MNIYEPRFMDEQAAREHLEAIQWPDGPECPHCGSDNATRLKGKKHRKGAIQCNDCRGQYTVTVGTVFERSKVPLHKWLLATHLLCSSKKGMSAHQIHRTIGVTYKTAWFMCHRIREAMTGTDTDPFGTGGTTVEADETYIGKEPGVKKGRGSGKHKMKVVSLIERETGRSRSIVIDKAMFPEVKHFLFTNVDRSASLMTDKSSLYKGLGKQYASHDSVDHRFRYVDEHDSNIHSNTVEGFFSIFKRGMKGVYQHCDKAHLQRYLAEFDFRYTNRDGNGVNDFQRSDIALEGIRGKRLTYRRTNSAAFA